MSSQPNQSLIDGIQCFQQLATSEVPLGTKDIAELLDVNVTRVNRLLKSLQSIGMVEQNSKKKYMPGPAVHLFAAQSFHSSKLFRSATNVVVEQEFDDRTLAVGLLWGESVVYMYHALPDQMASEGLGGYRLNHISKSSIGQALLAELPDDEIDKLIKHWEPKLRTEMVKKVGVIRKLGYAVIKDEQDYPINISVVFRVGSAKAAIAFTDFVDKEKKLEHFVEELSVIKERIESVNDD